MSDRPTGAFRRYQKRINAWSTRTRVLPKVRHDAWWFLHNAVSHPLLGLWPSQKAVWFHDWTSQHLNLRRRILHSPMPVVRVPSAWLKHNVLAHAAIAFFPWRPVFAWHDRTAAEMQEANWV